MRRILTSVFCVLISAAAAAPAPAATQSETLNQRYERARKSLEEQRAAEEETRAAHDQLAHEAEDLRQRLVANAARVQELEAAFADTEMEIAGLRAKETELAGALDRDHDRVARLLAVLQRLDADRPPALAMRPDDSLAAARGAMMLGSMLPPVYQEAYALRRQLSALAQTRTSLETKNNEAHSEAQALASARAELSMLLESRSQEADEAQKKLSDIHEVTEEIARQTSDLRSLMDRIEALRAEANPAQGMVVITPKTPGVGKIPVIETLQRGSLLRPVVGTATPGDSAGPGRTPGTQGLGLWFETAASAQAVAPADSEVVFAGPYQKFGQVLILELPGGYHLLLAGLDRIDVHIGDMVLAGEPVGVLPAASAARLYLELRRNGQTVDPVPWMSAELRKAKE